MSETQRERQSSMPGFERPNDPGLEGAWGAVETFGRAAEPMLKAYSRSNFEMASLVGRRASAYAALPGQMREVRGPADLIAAQLRFWEQARRDYMDAGEAVLSAWKSLATPASPLPSTHPAPEARRDILAVPDRDPGAADLSRPGSEPRRAA